MLFIKKSLICQEKDATFVKVKLQKLVTNVKKHNQLYLWNFVIVIVEITHKTQTFSKTLASKKAATRRLKISLSNNKFS